MEKIVNEIVKWLQNKTKEAGAKGLVVGVSGGLDSAVVAHLIKRAYPDDSLGVIMPLKSNPADVEHAQIVIEQCKIKSKTIDLTKAHDVLFAAINEALGDEADTGRTRLEDANLRARLRMSTLYAVASNYNYLVVGTDNAAEWYTGYFTKYGDGGVDLLPITPFTKGEVRKMAAHLGVPREVIEKEPSADLWEGQTDEKEMGTSYEMIDAFLKGEPIPKQDKEIIERLHKRSEHKRKAIAQFKLGE